MTIATTCPSCRRNTEHSGFHVRGQFCVCGWRRKEHTMPDFDLTAIKARAEAATPGPWEFTEFRPNDWRINRPDGDGGCWWLTEIWGGGDYDKPNAEFIAHARTDIPALVAEIERHRSCRYDIGLRDGSASELPQIERLKAEVERLRAEITRRERLTIDQAIVEMVDERARLAEEALGDVSVVLDKARAELDRLQEAAETLVDLITEHRAVEIQYQLTDRCRFYAAYREVKGEAYPFEALDERRRHNA